MDGMLKSLSKHSAQMYTIYADVGGQVNEIKKIEEVRTHLRMCEALAFMKEEDVVEG